MKKELNQISVDIILPNYNSAPYLSKTIDSIIDQTFKNWKLIIVDDSSNIETKKKLKIKKHYFFEIAPYTIFLPKKGHFSRFLNIGYGPFLCIFFCLTRRF